MIEVASYIYEKELNWYDANLYCSSLNIKGTTGWRLPTEDELDMLMYDIEFFYMDLKMDKHEYWTSDQDEMGRVWSGRRHIFNITKSIIGVRPVRDIT
jgi:hypothetical protein